MSQAAKSLSDELSHLQIDPVLASRLIADNILIKEIAIQPELQ